MSPDNTAGTKANKDMPAPQSFLMKHVVMRVAPTLGIAHPSRRRQA